MKGYIDRRGNFIDVSECGCIFAHDRYCAAHNIDEDVLLDIKGWVKLTDVLPRSYIYTRFYPMSRKQSSWLLEHGYKVEPVDMGG